MRTKLKTLRYYT